MAPRFTDIRRVPTRMQLYRVIHGHGEPWQIPFLRAAGFRCMGPYHSGNWYIFYSPRQIDDAVRRRNAYLLRSF